MKIHKLTATFGKLQQQTLELKDGLNIIEAPNEGGKSTWAGFLRAMLYGIDTKERDRKGVIAEKNRYQPWEGGSMEGTAELSWDGKEITLRRITGKANAPMGQFQAVYTGTEEPVPGLTADNVGEMLTGVGKEVYERSAFVGQSALAVTGVPELERRISAIVSSGQEDVSFSETEKKLREWRNRRQSNQKNGIIPKLEEERAQVCASLEKLDEANRQAAADRARLRVLESEKAALEEQARAHRALAGAQLRARRDAARAELEQAQAALEEVRRERNRHGVPPEEKALREMQGELSYLNTLDANIRQAHREGEKETLPELEIEHPVFKGMDPAAVKERANADAKAAKLHRETVDSKMSIQVRLVLVCVLLLAGVSVLLINYFADGNTTLYTIVGVLTVGAILAATVWNIVSRWKESIQVFKMLDAYGVREYHEIIEQAKDYIARWEAAAQARTDAAVRAVSAERLEAERQELSERLLDQAHTFAPEVTDMYGVSAAVSWALNLGEQEKAASLRVESAQKVWQAVSAQGMPEEDEAVPSQAPEQSEEEVTARLAQVTGEMARLNESLAMAQGEMNMMGDPAALQARLGELEAELNRRKEEYDAITQAMEGLDEANAELQARLSPELNLRAGEMLSRLTGGKYDQLTLTREFDAMVKRPNRGVPRKLLALSKGTIDQVYLAVRLAVCDLALPGEDPAPLVLDDALVNFDDRRLMLALDLLQQIGTTRQILLFTCQGRERACLKGATGVNFIRLQS